MRHLKIFIGLMLAVAVLLGSIALHAQRWLHQPIASIVSTVTYEVPRGTSMQALAQDLHVRGWIQYPHTLTLWARVTGQTKKIQAGEYQLSPGLSPATLINLLTTGKVALHSITIVEGTTFSDVLQLIAARTDIEPTLASQSEYDAMKHFGQPDLHPEGQFFPDTYHFAKGVTDVELLLVAYRRMQIELDAAWSQRAADLPFSTPYEALILASIVEKETALTQERPLIAGVFVERLRRQMRLQTDPTVIYGLGQSYDGNIRRSDLALDTPYNTYLHTGLPPTPICLPGLGALHAAVHPTKTDKIFFVATGMGDGSHYFSTTLQEHNQAVQRYLRRLRGRTQ